MVRSFDKFNLGRTRWEILIGFINASGHKAIAEIGIGWGETAMQIVLVCKLDQYFLVDRRTDLNLYTFMHPHPVSFIKMSSRAAAKYVRDGCLDLVFIDANHSYEAVKQDIELWLPKVRKGGIVSGHDYIVTEECPPRFAGYAGVKRAVDEFFSDCNLEVDVARKHLCSLVWWVNV